MYDLKKVKVFKTKRNEWNKKCKILQKCKKF